MLVNDSVNVCAPLKCLSEKCKHKLWKTTCILCSSLQYIQSFGSLELERTKPQDRGRVAAPAEVVIDGV